MLSSDGRNLVESLRIFLLIVCYLPGTSMLISSKVSSGLKISSANSDILEFDA